ncbi:MAG TPA: TetR/AcrR family transcriptional regulator [Fimbriimonadaceae bacterium]|jgi:AcrR family transcriptional regulator
MTQSAKPVLRKTLDPASTRRKIIDAAFESFADKGYAATSIGDVAAAAGVQKSLVQYHFGNKEELWQAALADRAAPVIAEVDKVLAGLSPDPSSILEARFNLLKQNPGFRKILIWSSMETVPLPKFIEERRAKLFSTLGITAGSPMHASILMGIAAVDGWFAFNDLYGRLIGQETLEQLEQSLLTEIKKAVSR